MTDKASILGITINTDSLDEVLQHIHHFIDQKTPHHITTVNTEFVMEARRNHAFKAVLDQADLCLADGAGILLAARLLKQPIPPRITGVDLVHFLAREAANEGYSIFLLGGEYGVAERTKEILVERHPGLKIVGTHHGFPEEPGLVEMIKKAHPDILLIAWGAPKQDVWIAKHKKELNIPVMMGVGGTFDFIVGKQKRAPKLWREHGLEWLWRLLNEPWRWKRQLALPQMFLLIAIQKLFHRS